MTQNKETKTPVTPAKPVPNRPNESGIISVEGFLKIFDPKTQETLVEKRA